MFIIWGGRLVLGGKDYCSSMKVVGRKHKNMGNQKQEMGTSPPKCRPWHLSVIPNQLVHNFLRPSKPSTVPYSAKGYIELTHGRDWTWPHHLRLPNVGEVSTILSEVHSMFPSAGGAAIQTASSHLAGKERSISHYSTCSCTTEFKPQRFKIKFQLVVGFCSPKICKLKLGNWDELGLQSSHCWDMG